MCGRVRLSADVSEFKLVFSIPAQRPTPNFPPSWNAALPTPPDFRARRVADGRTGNETRAMEAAQDAIKSAWDRAQLN